MRRYHLRWQLFASYILIALLVFSAVSVISVRFLNRLYFSEVSRTLEIHARRIERDLGPVFPERFSPAWQQYSRQIGHLISGRLTFILPSGQVIADSEEDPLRMENHADRPEVIDALEGKIGHAIRYSFTTRQDMLYLALPYRQGSRITGIIRVSVPTHSLWQILRQFYLALLLGGGISLLLASALSLLFSLRIVQPLEQIRESAEHFAQGDFSHKLPATFSHELAGLSESLNHMASQLYQRMQALSRQKNEQATMLASMAEGVLAVDPQQRVLNLNHAGSQLLGITHENPIGRTLQEVIRNSQIQQLVVQVLASGESREHDLVLAGETDRFLQAHGTPLLDAGGHRLGVLIVLNDVTRLRRLEALRREFVGNVSHELKTPITVIQGFVETLLDGALHDPGDALRFLGIINGQTQRLNAIIEDLLSLSRIEQEAERGQVVLEPGDICSVLKTAIASRESAAAAKKLTLELDCPASLPAKLNSRLLEQAVTNLIDNAVKYSDPGRSIHISAAAGAGEIVITVRDQGWGIAAEHLPRLFERFYRVDKGRSRDAGGTGLGLAIVKHILQAHNGRVSVESTPGQGSAFSLHLPWVEK